MFTVGSLFDGSGGFPLGGMLAGITDCRHMSSCKIYYMNEDGVRQTGFITVEGKTYYMGTDGVMQTGWLELDGSRYYLNEDGSRHTGWLEQGEYKYYLKEDGTAAKGRNNKACNNGGVKTLLRRNT